MVVPFGGIFNNWWKIPVLLNFSSFFSFFLLFIIIVLQKLKDINEIDTDDQDWQSHLLGQGGGGCLMKADPGVDELIFSDEGKAHAGRRPVAGSLASTQ